MQQPLLDEVTVNVTFGGGKVYNVTVWVGQVSKQLQRGTGDFEGVHFELRSSNLVKQLPALPEASGGCCGKSGKQLASEYQAYMEQVLDYVDIANAPFLRRFLEIVSTSARSGRFSVQPGFNAGPAVVMNPIRSHSDSSAPAQQPAAPTSAVPLTSPTVALAVTKIARHSYGALAISQPKLPVALASSPSSPVAVQPTGTDDEEREKKRRHESQVRHRVEAENSIASSFREAEEHARLAEQTAQRQIRKNIHTEGHMFIKHGRRGRPHQRLVFATDDAVYLCWGEPGKPRVKAEKVALDSMTEVISGMASGSFPQVEDARQKLLPFCFTVKFRDRELDLQCASSDERDLWVRRFTDLLVCRRSQEILW